MKKLVIIFFFVFVCENIFCQVIYYENIQQNAYGEYYGLQVINPHEIRVPYYRFQKENNIEIIEYINPLNSDDEISYWGTKKVVITLGHNLRIHDYYNSKSQKTLNDYGVSREEYRLLPDGRIEYLYNYDFNTVLCLDTNNVYYYGQRYENTNTQYIYRYNNLGKRISDNKNTFVKVRQLNQKGIVLQEEQYDSDGKIIYLGNYTTINFIYSDTGLVTEELFFEKNGFNYKKATNEYGIYRISYLYNTNGLLIEKCNYSEFNEPVADLSGVWKTEFQYNEYHQIHLITAYGVDGKEIEINGYSKVEYVYNDDGNLMKIKKYLVNNQEYYPATE